MSWMGAFVWNIHVTIFRFLIYFYTQYSGIQKIVSFEYIQVHICNTISKSPFIYKNVFAQLIKFINPRSNIFLLPLIIPKPSSMNLLNIIGHFIFLFLHIIMSSSSNIAIYIYISQNWC